MVVIVEDSGSRYSMLVDLLFILVEKDWIGGAIVMDNPIARSLGLWQVVIMIMSSARRITDATASHGIEFREYNIVG